VRSRASRGALGLLARVVYFTSSGRGDRGALKTARKHTRGVASRLRGRLHGNAWAPSPSRNPVYRAPSSRSCRREVPPFDDVAALPRCDALPAVVVEPVQPSGRRVPSPEFLPALRRAATRPGPPRARRGLVTGFAARAALRAPHWGVVRTCSCSEGARRGLRWAPSSAAGGHGDARPRPAARARDDLRRPPALCAAASRRSSAPARRLRARAAARRPLLERLRALGGRAVSSPHAAGLLLGLEFGSRGSARFRARASSAPHPQLDAPPRHGLPCAAVF